MTRQSPKKDPSTRPHAIWGGRFGAAPAGSDAMAAINASVEVDRHLAWQDIAGSRAHAQMLAACGIISRADREAIEKGLDRIAGEIAEDRFAWSTELEDVHMNIEARLAELIGEAAERLHTARSRNDQVATDFRLWTREATQNAERLLRGLIGHLVDRAEAEAGTVMPGMTHSQNAQPVTFGHHLLAYAEMFWRDASRFADAAKRMNECPLGSGALAGTGFAIDRDMTARALGFAHPARNSLDAVSSRDFAAEALAAVAICAGHLSRLAEELVMWASTPFGFVRLPDAWSTGSSMMPQKRNPDAAELVRAKAGRAAASLMGLTMVMKGLPLAYSKDMQEDKPYLFEAFAALELSLAATIGMVEGLEPDRAAMRACAGRGHTDATDLADWLVRELGLPFRRAHHVAGAAVREAEERGCDLAELPLESLRALEPDIHRGVYAVLGTEASVNSRDSFGGTAPRQVAKQVEAWRRRLAAAR